MTGRLMGIVLGGGRSSRMGTDKAMLCLPRGATFLQHAIQRLDALCEETAICGGDRRNSNTRLIPDPVAYQGPAVGVAAALQDARERGFEACLVTPVDTPLLTHQDLLRLKNSWLEAGCPVVAMSDRIEPLIAVYPVSLADDLVELTRSDDRSLMRWISNRRHQTVQLPSERLQNINTPEDLTRSHGQIL